MPEKIVSYEADRNQGGNGNSSLDAENPDGENTGDGMNPDGSQTNGAGNGNPGGSTTDSSNTTHIFPEEQKGLNYALLSTGESNLNIYSSQLHVTGDVHTNKTFNYSGTSIKVDGTLEASERVVLYTSSSADAQKIGKKLESATSISMPDITEKICTYAKTNGTYSKESISYNTDKVSLNKPILTDGSATFNASQFLGKGIIYAKDSISYNISSLATPEDSRIFLASQDGNINISGSNINLNAVLYAPNGTVNINCSSLNLNGRIIAKQVCLNGSYLNINAGPYDYEMIDFIFDNNKEDEDSSNNNDDTNKDDENSHNENKNEEDKDDENTNHIEDQSPVAVINGKEIYYRNEGGVCDIVLTNQSYSPDENEIVSEFEVTYDSDNDGVYETSQMQVNSSEGTYHIQTEKVGKYQAKLVVTEQTEKAQKDETKLIFEVANNAPSVSGNVLLEKKVTLMSVSNKDANINTEDDSSMNETIQKLTAEGYDVTYKKFHLEKEKAILLGEENYKGAENELENKEKEEVNDEESQEIDNQRIVLTSQKQQPEDEIVNLKWESEGSFRNLLGYKLLRKIEDDEYLSFSTWKEESHVRVLNVYPGIEELKPWMDSKMQGSEETFGKGIIEVDSVQFYVFNQNPNQYLLDEEGNYKYDILAFGFADCNGHTDLNKDSYQATLEFIQSGRGVLFGHDTVVQNAAQTRPYLAKFAEQMGLTFHIHGALDIMNSKVDVVKEGILTSYPWQLQKTVQVNTSHSSGQYVEGDFGKNTTVWMKYQGQKTITDDNYYLLTKNSLGMIQTGHSGGVSEDEKKILANTLCYLKQYSLNDNAQDNTAYDLKAPELTNVDTYFTNASFSKMELHLEGKDLGTTYQYYVQSVANGKNNDTYTSNVAKAETVTGLKGFVVKVDDNSSNIENLIEKEAVTGEIKNLVKAIENNAYVEVPTQYLGKECYAHICVVDYSGNVSEQQTVKINTTSKVCDLQQFLAEEADYILLDIDTEKYSLSEQATIEQALVETGAKILSSKNDLAEKVLQLEQQKQIKYQNHIFKGQTISFKTYYDDLENDPCCKEEISITHGDETDTICTSYEQQKEDTKTYTVSENGIYNISVKVQDDPTEGNDKLSNYKAWSESYTLAEELVCSNRPIITDLAVSESEENREITYDAYVPGKESLENKGISKVSFSWKKVGEQEWQEGELPENLDLGCIYLIKAVAEDEESIPSLPKVAIVDEQKINLEEGQSSLVIKNDIEILLLGTEEENYQEQLDELKEICSQEEYTFFVKTIGREESQTTQTPKKEELTFQKPQSNRFILVPDKAYEQQYLNTKEMQKHLLESGAIVLYGNEEKSFVDTIKAYVESSKKDTTTGILSGMEVEYVGKYQELAQSDNYAVRLIVEYTNAITEKTLISTYAKPFIPTKPGKYKITMQVAPKSKNGSIGKYQGESLIVSDFYVYERPSVTTITTLSNDTQDVNKIDAQVKTTSTVSGKNYKTQEVNYQWKTLDGVWQEGELPATITRGETYLLKTVVIDTNQVSSYPYIEVIETQDVEVPDVTAPVVQIEAPTNGETITAPVEIKGTVKDDCKLQQYTISYDDGRGNHGSTPYMDGENIESQKLGSLDFAHLPNGNYTITLTAKDATGLESTDSVSIINAHRLLTLTNVTVDDTYLYVHGKTNTINELQEVSYSYKKDGGEEISIEGMQKEETTSKETYETTIKLVQEGEEDYSDDHILSEEKVCFQVPLSQLESGSYTFYGKAKDTNEITTQAFLKAELSIKKIVEEKPEEKEDEMVTEEPSSLTLQFHRAEIVTVEKEEVTPQEEETISQNNITNVMTEDYVVVHGTYTSTHDITKQNFTLQNTTTNAEIPFDLNMDQGTLTLTAKVTDAGEGTIAATGTLQNSFGCEAYATCGFKLTLSEDEENITLEETENQGEQTPDTFPTLETISFNEDQTKVNIIGDLAGYENTTLTCEKVETGETIPVTQCNDKGIIGYLYTTDLQTGAYKVTLSVYTSAGELLGKLVAPFTYKKAEKPDIDPSVSNNTVSDNTISGNNLDKKAPIIEMDVEDEDYIITQGTNIKGSIYDETKLKEYTIHMIPEGEKEGVLIATGTEEIRDDVLGIIDPTILSNGTYQVVIQAVDQAGNKKTATMSVTVESKLKVGNMNIGFTDLVAKMSFGSLNLQRIYNSNNKTCGDFGYGWTMGMTGMTLTETNNLTEGYEQVVTGSGFGTTYHIKQQKNHDIVVNYGDGRSDRFKLVLSPDQKALMPIGEVKVGFTCQTSQGVTLEIDGDNSAAVEAGILVWGNEANFDEIKYVLTTKDNIKIYLTAKDGVYKIVDSTDNEITVDKNGYHGEGNKGITLTRNEEGLITSATDGMGKTLIYGYNEKKDLISFTNEAGNQIKFTYDDNHNLLSIIDPMGVATARNEYDENGRLIATIDADGNRMEYTYDVEGKNQAVKDRRGNTTVYTYDENGNILKTVDALGNATYNTYDTNGNVLTKTDANGNTTSYSYDENGNVTKVQAADGTTVESSYTQQNYVCSIQMLDKTIIAMDYDEKGRITEITDANGNETSYQYNSDGKLTSLTDKIGQYQKVTYDEEGNVISTTNGAGESATYTYDKDGNCNSITISREENGETKTFTSHYIYDKSGNIKKSTDNAGNITTYEYDKNNNQTASIDAKGRKIAYTYDDMGNLVKTTYPDGTYEAFVYDENGNTIQATDRNGFMAHMTYDKLNRLTSKTYADGTKESYTYDAVGNLLSQTSATGAKTTYTYNNRNLNTSITDSYGAVTTFEYDKEARLIKTTDNEGNKLIYEYDANGNKIKTTYADGTCVTSTYDARNRVTEQEDANGNKTKYTYDGADRLSKVTDTYGNSYNYGYDGNGNLITVTDPNENTTTYTYDALGRVETMTNALGKKVEYHYDSTGNLISSKDYAGIETIHTYDTMDRITSTTIDGKTTTYTYTQDNLTKVADENGEVNFAYDKYNRLITKTDAKGNQIDYHYDQYGRMESITVEGKKTTYEYDLLDRVTRVIDHNGQATVYEYDSLGNRSAVRYPNGTILTYTYDVCQRLKEECLTDANGKQLAKYNYTLGKAGERTKITETKEDGTITEISYKYDKLNRLVKEEIECDGSKLINEFTYDAVSNRISKETSIEGDITKIADIATSVSVDTKTEGENTTPTAATTETINTISLTSGTENAEKTNNSETANNAEGSNTGATLSKNDYEIQVTEGKTEYAYNDLNQLIRETNEDKTIIYEYDVNGNLIKQTGDKTITYTYDRLNHLLQATVQKGNAVTTETYEYDYAGNRISKQVNGGNKTYYIMDESSGLAQVVAEVEITKDASNKETKNLIATYTLNGNERISLEREGNTSYYLYDGHGNVRALTNQDGEITDNYLYDAYGNLLQAEGKTKNDFLYTGEQYNANTGLYYLRARYMNPSTGTFISMDSYQGSIYDPVTLHKYLYANANPVKYTDPTGYFSISESSVATTIQSTLSSVNNFLRLHGIIRWANAICTVYDTAMEIRNVVLADGSVVDIVFALLKGITVGFMLDGMCKTPLGVILKPMMAIFGLADQTDQIVEAIKSGDPVEITVRFVQLICMLFGISSQCFTGETLVSTENGFVQISEINVGDYVWTENVETGEKELKQVLQVYVNQTDTLVHLSITDENGSETIINTTENHPFYTEGEGWVTASQLKAGDKLHTKDGKKQVVREVSLEKLEVPVKVYNLEVDEQHTYFVSRVGVLVHNECKVEGGGHGPNQHHKDTINAKIEELKNQEGIIAIWANRALTKAGLVGSQRPDIIALFETEDQKKLFQIFEFASPSQAKGTRGYEALRTKIEIMKKNNIPKNNDVIIEFLEIFNWSEY